MSLLKFSSSPQKHGYLGGDEKFSFKCFLSNTTAVKLSPTVKRPKSNAVTPTGISRVKSSHWQALFLEQGHQGRQLEVLRDTSVFKNKLRKQQIGKLREIKQSEV